MTPKRWILPLSLIITLATTGSLVFAKDASGNTPPADVPGMAQSSHHGYHGHHGQWQGGPGEEGMKQHKEAEKQEMDKFLTSIGVTDAQKKQMNEIREASKNEAEPVHESLKTQHKALMSFMNAPDATEAGALEKAQAINKLQAQLSEIKIKSMFRVRSVLTGEQQQKLSAHMQEKMQNWKEGKEGQEEKQPKSSANPEE